MCCRAPYTASVSIWDIEALEREREDSAAFLALGSSRGPHPATVRNDRPAHKREERRSALWWLDQPADDGCTFLADGGGCTVYNARPNGCAQYPHTLVFTPIDSPKLVARHSDVDGLDLAVRIAASAADGAAAYVPLILRDTACPGFTGPPIGHLAYQRLLIDLWAWGACFDANRPCERHPHSTP
jgi:Fe-S-cluster containining protein